MDEQLKAIDEYYANLEYRNDMTKKKALAKISALTEEMKITNVDHFSERFLAAASIIEKNLSLFKTACKHPDTITTIIKYLNYFGMKFILDNTYDEYEKDDVVLLAILTIIIIQVYNPSELEMMIFLKNAIIKNSTLEKSVRYDHWKNKLINHNNEIILLGDSDLYAAIRFLRNTKSIMSINKFWVQEPIREKFLWLVKEYLGYSFPICVFRTKAELFTARNPNTMNIVSIWTEDIVFAKNLAMSLDRDVVFINTFMDFYDGTVLLPYTKVWNETLCQSCKPNFDDSIEKLSVQKSSVYNLFYDGMWQRPVKDTYWVHNDSQWANATSDDINKCINSAEKGFKIWSGKSITSRMQILSKFASTLEYNGESALADVVSTWIKFSCIYKNSSSCSQSRGLEVTKIRNSKGVIILKEEDPAVLFCRLVQILTVGNSVIVICDTNSYSLAPYCNIFSISEIPPGVINLLSSENIKKLELFLCGMDYASYAKQFFPENNLEKTYINLTKPKQIIVPLK